MSAGYVISMDPSQIASRFSNNATDDDLLDLIDGGKDPESALLPDEPPEEWLGFETQIEPLLERIPKREADLIYLYFVQRKRQADIAAIFGVTQAAISYRLDRGIQRIKFLLSIPHVTEEDMRRDLPLVFPHNIDVDILVGMWATTCQSEVASKLGLTQGRVRHRFFRAVDTLKGSVEKYPELAPYYAIFSAISCKKFNVLREVRLPQWANRGGSECV